MVVSGAPVKTKFHAVYVTDMSLDMIEAIKRVPDPSKPGNSLRIRLGKIIQQFDSYHEFLETCYSVTFYFIKKRLQMTWCDPRDPGPEYPGHPPQKLQQTSKNDRN